jgi:uncharacterized membrane protein
MRPSRAIIILLIALALLQAAHYAPLLPDPVASRFDSAGQPNDWMSRRAFVTLNLVMFLGMAALFLGLPPLLRKIPNEWINMPRKDYWLAPERRDATLDTIARWMEWLGAATLALLLGITQLTIEANLSGGQQLDNTAWVITAIYIVVMGAWVIGFLVWAFKKPSEQGLI